MHNGNYEFFDFQGNPALSASGSSYDNGILVGSYVTSTGETLGYYANVPEPKTGLLVSFSAALTLFYRRRRKS
jgi:hypothetical protein